CMQAIEFPNSF
nr:immunoglobulin light chain junction region [Macaca mulatta]MOV35057.1 immunoglobulin light chain junction region [Macaca mulatta]